MRNNCPKFGFLTCLRFSSYHLIYRRGISRSLAKNEISHNSKTSNDIDMKPEPTTRLDKRNTTTSKKITDFVMAANCMTPGM